MGSTNASEVTVHAPFRVTPSAHHAMRVALSGLRFPPWSISLFVFIHAGGLHGAAVPHTVGRIRDSQCNDDLLAQRLGTVNLSGNGPSRERAVSGHAVSGNRA